MAKKHRIKLDRAWIKGARRKFRLQFTSRWGAPFAHLVRSSYIYHVAEDAIVITDGDDGYLPFSISELRKVLEEAQALPIVSEIPLT